MSNYSVAYFHFLAINGGAANHTLHVICCSEIWFVRAGINLELAGSKWDYIAKDISVMKDAPKLLMDTILLLQKIN